jgi:hypothetical protein
MNLTEERYLPGDEALINYQRGWQLPIPAAPLSELLLSNSFHPRYGLARKNPGFINPQGFLGIRNGALPLARLRDRFVVDR